MENVRPIETWLTDMDGVLVHEEDPIPGAQEFIEALKASGKKFLVLTNNSIFTPARPAGAAARQRHRHPGGGDLDLGPGHGATSSPTSGPAAARTSWARPG